MNDPFRAFGRAVREERCRQKISQKQLAQKLGMSVRTIMSVENSNGNPRFETICLLARALNISVDAAIFEEGKQSSEAKERAKLFLATHTDEEIDKFVKLCETAELVFRCN